MQRMIVHLICVVITAAAVAGVPGCTSQQSGTPQAPASEPAPIVRQRPRLRIIPARLAKAVHDRINRERRRRRLPTFRRDAALGRIAGKHSRDMAKRNYFGHISPGGAGPAQRYLKEHYACGVTVNGVLRSGAEVIFRLSPADAQTGSRDRKQARSAIAGRIVDGWLEHEKDRANVLSPYWQRVGVGVYVTRDGMIYVTVNYC